MNGKRAEWEPQHLREWRADFQSNPALVAEVFAQYDTDERAAMLSRAEGFISNYVVLPPAARLPVALWAVATHAADSSDAFPYLCFSSPLPRCGKTRAIEVLELLVRRPWRGTTPSEAGLFRFLADCPTLLLDEVEGLSAKRKSDRDQAIVSILNSGYRKGATVLRWDVVSRTAERIPVYGPKAFCVVGNLPPTLVDRSIVIPMQRRRVDEAVRRFRFARSAAEAKPIQEEIERRVKACADELGSVYAELPGLDFLSDRDEELFGVLFAVCSVFAPCSLRRGSASLNAARACYVGPKLAMLRTIHCWFGCFGSCSGCGRKVRKIG